MLKLTSVCSAVLVQHSISIRADLACYSLYVIETLGISTTSSCWCTSAAGCSIYLSCALSYTMCLAWS